jgi:transcription termination/antitermination protein NusA
MNSELIAVLNYMEKERGLNREVLIQSLESALDSAARKSLGQVEGLRIEIDRKTADIRAYGLMEVIDGEAPKDNTRVSLSRAKRFKHDIQVGEKIEMEMTPKDFGRIAAQTAKQAIIQKLRQAERDLVFDEYKDRVGDIVTGTVRQFNRSDVVVDLGRARAILPAAERVPTEDYQIGDRIRAYVLLVEQNSAAPGIILSRNHDDFIKALFKLEVSEIAEGIVEIKGIAREPGCRTKIAVRSKDDKVDPVGACVGMRGVRVKNIVRELNGEKIDIVRWSDDIKAYTSNALSPAKLLRVVIDNDRETIHVICDAEQLSLAIGKRGQNVRLTSRLLGWKVDIQKDEAEFSFEEKVAKATQTLAKIEGIGADHAATLVKSGFLTAEGILASEVSDLAEVTGFDMETAGKICEAAARAQPQIPEE